MPSEAGVGRLKGVEEQGHLLHLVQHPGHHGAQAVPAVRRLDGHVDVKAAPRRVRQRLGTEIGVQAVALRDELDDGLEGHHIVRRRHRVGVAEVDLVLAGTLLVVGALGENAHLGQGEADLPTDVLPLVVGGNVHVARPVIGDLGGFPVPVPLEQIEFLLRAEEKGIPLFLRLGRPIPQQGPVNVAGDQPHSLPHHHHSCSPPRSPTPPGGGPWSVPKGVWGGYDLFQCSRSCFMDSFAQTTWFRPSFLASYSMVSAMLRQAS